MLPIRCFTCGYVISKHELEFKNRVEQGEKVNDILNSLKISSYCCRRMFLGHVDLMDKLLLYPNVGCKNFNIDK